MKISGRTRDWILFALIMVHTTHRFYDIKSKTGAKIMV
jgi:hypothetical protein